MISAKLVSDSAERNGRPAAARDLRRIVKGAVKNGLPRPLYGCVRLTRRHAKKQANLLVLSIVWVLVYGLLPGLGSRINEKNTEGPEDPQNPE